MAARSGCNHRGQNPNLGQRQVTLPSSEPSTASSSCASAKNRGLESYGQLRALTEQPASIRNSATSSSLPTNDTTPASSISQRKGPRRKTRIRSRQPSPSMTRGSNPILKKLYYPTVPYAFRMYGRHSRPGLRAVPWQGYPHHPGTPDQVELKPEVKKAGGVYYTPTYIVDYIVKSTVGKLLEGKSPKQVAAFASWTRPAVGAPSHPLYLQFLMESFSYLLRQLPYWLN